MHNPGKSGNTAGNNPQPNDPDTLASMPQFDQESADKLASQAEEQRQYRLYREALRARNQLMENGNPADRERALAAQAAAKAKFAKDKPSGEITELNEHSPAEEIFRNIELGRQTLFPHLQEDKDKSPKESREIDEKTRELLKEPFWQLILSIDEPLMKEHEVSFAEDEEDPEKIRERAQQKLGKNFKIPKNEDLLVQLETLAAQRDKMLARAGKDSKFPKIRELFSKKSSKKPDQFEKFLKDPDLIQEAFLQAATQTAARPLVEIRKQISEIEKHSHHLSTAREKLLKSDHPDDLKLLEIAETKLRENKIRMKQLKGEYYATYLDICEFDKRQKAKGQKFFSDSPGGRQKAAPADNNKDSSDKSSNQPSEDSASAA